MFPENPKKPPSNTSKQMAKLIIEEARRRQMPQDYIEHQKKVFDMEDIDRSSM